MMDKNIGKYACSGEYLARQNLLKRNMCHPKLNMFVCLFWWGMTSYEIKSLTYVLAYKRITKSSSKCILVFGILRRFIFYKTLRSFFNAATKIKS